MPFKVNISQRDKTYKIELELADALMGKSIGDKVDGKDVDDRLEGYELEIMGGTDKAGFPMYSKIEGIGLKRVLLTKGWGMKDSRNGVRLRKAVRGKSLSENIVQINFMVSKAGSKKLDELFASAPVEGEGASAGESAPAEVPAAEEKKEEVKEEKVEEKKDDAPAIEEKKDDAPAIEKKKDGESA